MSQHHYIHYAGDPITTSFETDGINDGTLTASTSGLIAGDKWHYWQWVRPKSVTTSDNFRKFVNASSSRVVTQWQVIGGALQFMFLVINATVNRQRNIRTAIPGGFALNEWHLVEVWRDGASTGIRVDGADAPITVLAGGLLAGDAVVNAANLVLFGPLSANSVNSFQSACGLVDGDAGSLAAHQARYASRDHIADPAATSFYYRFDNATGNTVVDQSGNNRTLTLTNAVTSGAGNQWRSGIGPAV
jgi:hypothetical protein